MKGLIPSVVVFSFSGNLPRIHTRVATLKKAAENLKVYYYARPYFNVNEFTDDIDVENMGMIGNGKLVRRILKYISHRNHILRQNPEIALLYCFGWDTALIGLTLRPKKFILEIGDLRTTPEDFWLKRLILQTLERFILRYVDTLVITSAGFRSYFEKFQVEDILLIENMVNEKLPALSGERVRDTGKINIGYVGNIRYRPITFLKVLGSDNGNFNVHVFGDGVLRDSLFDCEGVQYHGPFKNPQDLGGIYQQLDLNYVVYDTQSYNVRFALPNKLYESMYYRIPLVVARDTYLAEIVEELDIGFSVDSQDEQAAIDRISNICIYELERFKNNISKIKAERYMLFEMEVINAIIGRYERS